MRKIILAILVTVYLLSGPGYPLNFLPLPFRALSYHFFHGNIFHLALNCLSLWYVFDPRKRDNFVTLCWSIVIASLCYPLSWRPVIGASNIIFASVGLRTPALSHKWWRSTPAVVFLSITLLMGLLPQVAATTHIASFLVGAGIAAARRRINVLDHDIERAAH